MNINWIALQINRHFFRFWHQVFITLKADSSFEGSMLRQPPRVGGRRSRRGAQSQVL